jgi:HEAT repeat protein
MFASTPSLEELKRDIASEKQNVRAPAMNRLLSLVQKDAGTHAEALKVFQSELKTERDPWTVNWAISGIEKISGADEATRIRLSFLNHPRPELVTNVVGLMKDPSCVQPLIELLTQRSEPNVRVTAIRVLGRIGGDSVLPALVTYLSDPTLRPHVVEALSELRDPRAIPYLQPLLNDKTPAWEVDNHGPMLHVSDLATEALAKLRR